MGANKGIGYGIVRVLVLVLDNAVLLIIKLGQLISHCAFQSCPGCVATDVTDHQGTLTVDEGADTPIYLAMDQNAPHGQFVYQRQPVDWLSQEQFF
ncbi:carbonyl reductase [Aphelenchoides avenae]|nr:carbonyl reductase [Aphelenchus avenae]